MAPVVLMDCRVELNAVVISTSTKKATSDFEREEKDSTTFGGSGWKSSKPGLRGGTIALEFVNDYAAAALDSQLWALFDADAAVAIKVRPTSSAIGTSNPEYAGSVTVTKYSPLDATVGDLAAGSVSWPTTGLWARNTS